MVIKRKDFQKAAAFIHEFLLKLSEDVECADVRDTLNLALLHMQKYYRLIQSRSQEKCATTLSLTARGLSPMTPFVDAPDKFIWRWVNLDSAKIPSTMSLGDSVNFVVLPTLILAVKEGDLEGISDIIHQEPNSADVVDGLGRTGIMYAVHFQQHEALRYLLEQKSDANYQAHDGSTAIHRACHDGNHIALKILVDYGGDFTICDVYGRAPIHWAVTTRGTECLQILLAHNAYSGVRDKDGLTPCMWACRMDNIKHFELLCNADNKPVEDDIERDLCGRTLVHWSVRRTQPLECLQTLLSPETASIKDEEGKTVLLLAAEMGSLNACRLIVEIAGEGCILDQDNQGRTALHLATMGGHGDVVNFLLENNADVNIVDSFKATAWDYARIRKLHYCQLIIMSHQRQRMTSNPNSPMPNGLGLLMKEENGVQYDFSRMSFRTGSNVSTPITPPHPPKRPRSSRSILVRRSSSLTSVDRERPFERDKVRLNQAQESNVGSGKKERLLVNVSTAQKRLSSGEVVSNFREDTIMTDSSRPVFEDENDEISEGGMDVSDIEDEAPQAGFTRAAYTQAHTKAPRVRPQPAARPSFAQSSNVGNRNVNVNNNNQVHQRHLQETHPPPQQQYQQQQQYQRMEFEDTAAGPSPRALDNQQQARMFTGNQQSRPQARVPPTPLYRTARGAPIPSPPSTIPQRPHMIRHQQPLPSSNIRAAPAPPQNQLILEPSPPSVRDPSPPLSSQSSDTQQPGSRSQTDRPNSGANQPPGILEGRRIPPPALTPLQNAPKPPSLDMFDQSDRKKKKKKKDRDRRDAKSPPQKAENPLDIPPPRGFAAPLHPHLLNQNPQIGRQSSAAPPPPRLSKGVPAMSETRYIDENQTADIKSTHVIGHDVQATRENGHAGQARDNSTNRHKGHVDAEGEEENERAVDGGGFEDEGEAAMQTSTGEEEAGLLIPPPPSFRGVSKGRNTALAQSIPQDSKNSRMTLTSAKPPLPKTRTSGPASSPRNSVPRPPGRSALGQKHRPRTPS